MHLIYNIFCYNLSFSLGQLNSNLILHNIYEMNEFIDSKPLFTTKTDEFQGWIDHIWTNNKIDVDMVLSPPIRSGDLEANIKGRRFAPIPNKVIIIDIIML